MHKPRLAVGFAHQTPNGLQIVLSGFPHPRLEMVSRWSPDGSALACRKKRTETNQDSKLNRNLNLNLARFQMAQPRGRACRKDFLERFHKQRQRAPCKFRGVASNFKDPWPRTQRQSIGEPANSTPACVVQSSCNGFDLRGPLVSRAATRVVTHSWSGIGYATNVHHADLLEWFPTAKLRGRACLVNCLECL